MTGVLNASALAGELYRRLGALLVWVGRASGAGVASAMRATLRRTTRAWKLREDLRQIKGDRKYIFWSLVAHTAQYWCQ